MTDPQLQAVLFDLDGTLVDSVPGIHQALDLALSECIDSGCSETETRHWVGNGPQVLVRRALQTRLEHEPDDATVQSVLAAFSGYYQRTVYQGDCYPGVTNGLTQLRESGLQLACITNKPSEFTTPYLQHLGLADYFETVICADQVSQPKPHPESLQLACQRLGVTPLQAVMVGDSINDLQPARALNMPGVAVSYGYHQGEDLSAQRPCLIADQFRQVTAWLLARSRLTN